MTVWPGSTDQYEWVDVGVGVGVLCLWVCMGWVGVGVDVYDGVAGRY